MSATRQPPAAHDQGVDHAITQLRGLVRLMMGGRMDAWAELDVTVPQIKLLLLLTQAESLTVGQVGERMGVGQSAASHVVERLVQARLAERREDPADRRRAIVRLSRRGRAVSGNLLDGTEFLRGWLAALTPPELAALSEGVGALLRVAGRRDGPDGPNDPNDPNEAPQVQASGERNG